MEEEFTKARNCREITKSIYWFQFTFPYDRFRALESGGTDAILWKLTSLRLVFDTAKAAARLEVAAKDPSTQYNSPVFRTHRYGYNFFVQLYGLDSAAGNHVSKMFALFPGDYDSLVTWPFPTTIHLSVRDQLDPPKKVNHYILTLREAILSWAYTRTVSYLVELQLLPPQQDVQQN